MGQKRENSSNIQKEALINEIKGTLLEYLVALNVSKHFGFEERFIEGIDGSLKEKFSEYEIYLRNSDVELLHRLPEMAKAITLKIVNDLDLKGINSVFLFGKSKNDMHKETDIELRGDNYSIPISLKLCKYNSYVNTKSGGVRSFFEKYFSDLLGIGEIQREVNEKIDTIFFHMAYDLYKMNELDYSDGFCNIWEEREFPTLPGELSVFERVRVHQSYHEIIKVFYKATVEIYNSSSDLFKRALLPLIGIGKKEMVQVTCFHEEKKGKRYLIREIKIFDSRKEFSPVEKIEILPLKAGVSSFEIKLLGKRLQIRIKPMNKFTVPSYKVNCSVKEVR